MDKLIKFVAEYTDGSYNYLCLMTGPQEHGYCSKQGCMTTPDCTLFDVEGDPVEYCKEHILTLDNDPDLEGWSKVTDTSPHEAIRSWIKNSPALFIEIL